MLVSVVIPTHKRPAIVKRAIDSVLNQTYRDFEIIVVSDGFDEETDLTMLKFKNHQFIHYFSYKDAKGGNYARNYGIKKAKGELIAFLDDDDVFEPSKIEKQVQIFKNKKEIGLVYTGFRSIYPHLGLSYISYPKQSGDLSKKIFDSNYIGSTSRVIARKDIIVKAGMFDINLPALQDYDLWMRICQITKIGFVSEPLLTYINEDENNQISKNADKKRKAINMITKKYGEYFEDKASYYEEFDKRYYLLMLSTAQANHDNEGIKKYSQEYLSKYKTLKDRIFVLKYRIPFEITLRIKSIINH